MQILHFGREKMGNMEVVMGIGTGRWGFGVLGEEERFNQYANYII